MLCSSCHQSVRSESVSRSQLYVTRLTYCLSPCGASTYVLTPLNSYLYLLHSIHLLFRYFSQSLLSWGSIIFCSTDSIVNVYVYIIFSNFKIVDFFYLCSLMLDWISLLIPMLSCQVLVSQPSGWRWVVQPGLMLASPCFDRLKCIDLLPVMMLDIFEGAYFVRNKSDQWFAFPLTAWIPVWFFGDFWGHPVFCLNWVRALCFCWSVPVSS